jgi:demethylmenaquinone methyltransferase/2-methoxy-6-polyprenyl-1,4-benzoquinol methylase
MARVEDAIWTTEGSRKRSAVQGMFAEIAPTYDLLNSILSLSLHHRWRRFAVSSLELQPGDDALDVCCGTGDFMKPLRAAVGQQGLIVGMDFCEPMLVRARDKVHESLSLADACCLPVGSSQFDGVTVGWGIRNVPDFDAAHQELFRVLKPGGHFVSLDMAVPVNPIVRTVSKFVTNMVIPNLGSLFGKTAAYTYLPKSTQKFWTREQLADSMQRAGFIDIKYKDLLLGNVCVHFARKPGARKA